MKMFKTKKEKYYKIKRNDYLCLIKILQYEIEIY